MIWQDLSFKVQSFPLSVKVLRIYTIVMPLSLCWILQDLNLVSLDDKTALRNLVTGRYMPDNEYYFKFFSFQTVFNRTSLSYCCCPCSFEHEFLDYISEDGQINEAMFERITENILNGKCPHTDKVAPEYVTETGIYGMHITAAVGPLRAVKKYSHNYFYKRGRIFNLDPYQVAVLKNNGENVDLLNGAYVMGCRVCNSNSPHKKRILYATRNGEHRNMVQLYYIPILEACARNENSLLMDGVLNSDAFHDAHSVARSLELVLKSRQSVLQGQLLKYITKRTRFGYSYKLYVQSAIVADQPSILPKILNLFPKDKMNDEIKQMLVETCSLLNRKRCQEILFRNGIVLPRQVPDTDNFSRMHTLVDLIDVFSESVQSELQTVLEDLSINRASKTVDGSPDYQRLSLLCLFLHEHLKSYGVCQFRDDSYSRKLNILLTLGADIDYKDGDGKTAITQLLSRDEFQRLPRRRELLELLIYENSSTEINTSVVKLAFKHDANLQRANVTYDMARHMPGRYLTDTQEHSVFGHDDVLSYALNFTGPLLIECGYPVTPDELMEALEEQLHTAEHAYMRQCLDYPRPLQLLCRDVLRRHFKGRDVHRFVNNSNIPKHIGDFILLKPILANIQTCF